MKNYFQIIDKTGKSVIFDDPVKAARTLDIYKTTDKMIADQYGVNYDPEFYKLNIIPAID